MIQTISEYLLYHKDGIHQLLKDTVIESKDNPILQTYLREAIVNRVILHLAGSLQLNYEQIAQHVDYNYLVALLGEEFFKL